MTMDYNTNRKKADLASVIDEIYTKFSTLTPEEAIHKVLLDMGFTSSSRSDFDYQKETDGAVNFVRVDPDSVYLKLYGKHSVFTDSGYIGPPLPSIRELVEFIESEIG